MIHPSYVELISKVVNDEEMKNRCKQRYSIVLATKACKTDHLPEQNH